MTAGTPTVLVVEDSPLAAEALGVLLEASGYAVRVAGSLAAARAALGDGAVRAVLLDLTLPDGDGLALLTRPAEGGAAVPPTLALTGYDDPDTEARCRAAGCRAVLTKPVPSAVLLAALRDAGVPPRG